MGSYAKAVMVGFICRLCSEQKKIVVHLYGEKAKEMDLLNKVMLIPISIEENDHLPKTICQSCIDKLEFQYKLIQKIKRSVALQRTHRLHHGNGRCPTECPLHGYDPAIDSINEESAETIQRSEEQR